MEYNTELEDLVIQEYGRNIQRLIRHCQQIENDDERQAFAESVVELMYQMNPQSKNINNYKDKLWHHIFRIANYDLDVQPPNGDKPEKEEALAPPDPIPYPVHEAKYRHYGHHVQVLVQKALEMDDEDKREEFAKVIGSYMKLAYKTWNKKHFVNDESIKEDLYNLSDGKLELDSKDSLNYLRRNKRKRRN